MVVYGDLTPWVAVLVNAALIVYLALFPAIFALSVRRLVFARGQAWLKWCRKAPLMPLPANIGCLVCTSR